MARKKSDQEKEYKVISLTIHKDILAKVDRLIGQGGNKSRSAFIAKAIEEKLARDRAAGGLVSGGGGPGGERPGGGGNGGGEPGSGSTDLETIRRLVREEIDRRLGGHGHGVGDSQAGDPENKGNKKTGPDGNGLAGTFLDIFKGLS